MQESLTDSRAYTTEVRLMPKERQILEQLANGYTREMTALQVGLAKQTVDTYISKIIAALDANNVIHAVALAIRQGLI